MGSPTVSPAKTGTPDILQLTDHVCSGKICSDIIDFIQDCCGKYRIIDPKIGGRDVWKNKDRDGCRSCKSQ